MTWRRLFRLPSRTRADVRRDIDDEFAFHLAMRIEALERDGLNRDAARAQATAEFGDRRAARAHCAGDGDGLERRRRFARAFGEVRQDVAYGARLLRRSPGFSLAAIVTLTIGIGGNTAVFGLVNALLL